MRVMLDTNVLVSSILLDSPAMRIVVDDAILNHDLLLGSYVIDELKDVAVRKFPAKANIIDAFIEKARFTIIPTPSASEAFQVEIRDPKDAPVLSEAIMGQADILVTGDKDFSDLVLHSPEILTPAEYIQRYVK